MVTKLTLEYDGTDFAGWARQPGRRTVQAELEGALAGILGTPVPVTVAGRTDRGVHARGQVASYQHEALDPRRVNALLADDVAVVDSRPAAAGFDARRDAVSRTYCYRVLARRPRSPLERGRALWWSRPIDTEALDACAAMLLGVHDFTAFTPGETEHVHFERRVLRACWERGGQTLSFWIEADAFMRHMNRTLVGTMLEVAGARRTVEGFGELLTGRPRSEAGETAPAHGLYLTDVSYPHPS